MCTEIIRWYRETLVRMFGSGKPRSIDWLIGRSYLFSTVFFHRYFSLSLLPSLLRLSSLGSFTIAVNPIRLKRVRNFSGCWATRKRKLFEEAERPVVCRHAAVPAVGSCRVEGSQIDQRVILDRYNTILGLSIEDRNESFREEESSGSCGP